MTDILAHLAAISTIYGWAFFSFWSAVPAGTALNVAPVSVFFTVTVSYGSGVALVVLVGAPLRERIRRRMARRAPATGDGPAQPPRSVAVIQQAWTRCGLIGLALLAPMTVGAQVGAVIGLGFGAKPLRLLAAMTLGAAAWALALVIAVQTGLMALTG
ncbi:MAG: hypothetical protein ACOCYT_05390 [Chloroflexota bacterium]